MDCPIETSAESPVIPASLARRLRYSPRTRKMRDSSTTKYSGSAPVPPCTWRLGPRRWLGLNGDSSLAATGSMNRLKVLVWIFSNSL